FSLRQGVLNAFRHRGRNHRPPCNFVAHRHLPHLFSSIRGGCSLEGDFCESALSEYSHKIAIAQALPPSSRISRIVKEQQPLLIPKVRARLPNNQANLQPSLIGHLTRSRVPAEHRAIPAPCWS